MVAGLVIKQHTTSVSTSGRRNRSEKFAFQQLPKYMQRRVHSVSTTTNCFTCENEQHRMHGRL